MLGYTLYVLLFIATALCLTPDSVLVIVGSVLSDFVAGALISLMATTMTSTLSFLLARWLGRDPLLEYVGHTATFQAIKKDITRSGVDFLVLTRLVPLFPCNIQDYTYGLTAVPFWLSTVISAPATLPSVFIRTLISHELASEGITLVFTGKLSMAGPALFALVQVAKAWARHKHTDPSASHGHTSR